METTLELSNLQLGSLYDSLPDNLKNYLDNVIRYGNCKIATIKFFRSEWNISLTLAKILYEERFAWLNRQPNPFGWH